MRGLSMLKAQILYMLSLLLTPNMAVKLFDTFDGKLGSFTPYVVGRILGEIPEP